MNIRRKLTIWFTLLVGFIIFIRGLVSWFAMRENLYDSSLQEAYNKAREVQQVITTLYHEYQRKKILFKTDL